MQKTKLGISVGLFGAALYFAGLFGGYVALFLLAGYVLLREENIWLRKAAVKAVAFTMAISLLNALLGLIPGAIGVINDICVVFDGYFSIRALSNIITMLRSIISFAESIVLIILGIKALNQGTITLPVIDKLIDKYMDK